jgi:hypothetical protein
MAIPDTRPTEQDVYPTVDTTVPCGMCGALIQGSEFGWVDWSKHLAWHQWVWDQLNPV